MFNHKRIVWLDNESYWLIKPLKKREKTWAEWLANEEPLENQWNEDFYFDPGSWMEGSFIQVYNSNASHYKDYPYILMNTQTRQLAFAKLVCPSQLRLPKLEAARSYFDYPISDSLSITRNLQNEVGIIMLEDGPWDLFEIDRVEANWNEWWNNIYQDQPDHEFFSTHTDWLVFDPIQVYFRNFALTKAAEEYGMNQVSAGSFLIENKRSGKFAYAIPMENKDFIDRLLNFGDRQYNLGYANGESEGYSNGYSLGYRDGQNSND